MIIYYSKKMSKMNRRNILISDLTDWLLEEDNPSVRFFTLIDILDEPPDNREVTQARKNIMKTGIVPKILEKQKEGGYWERAEARISLVVGHGRVGDARDLDKVGIPGSANARSSRTYSFQTRC
jgi:hypothetical protein